MKTKAKFAGIVIAITLLCINSIPMASSQTSGYKIIGVDILFDVQADLSVMQTISYRLDRATAENLTYDLAEAVDIISVSDGQDALQYTLLYQNGSYMLVIIPEEPTDVVEISFVSDRMVFSLFQTGWCSAAGL